MTFSAAARHSGAFAGSFAGFSVPGIEVYEHGCDGAPCEPCEVDVGETGRPRWVNRQDHGALTRVNIARANHPNAPYCCADTGLTCGHPDLRTTVYGPDAPYDDSSDGSAEDFGGQGALDALPDSYAGQVQTLDGRRALVQKLRQGAAARKRAIAGAAGAASDGRSRRLWGNHNNHTEQRSTHDHAAHHDHAAPHRDHDQAAHHDAHHVGDDGEDLSVGGDGPIGIRYIPMAGQPGPLMEDALIVAPGHHAHRSCRSC